MNEPEPPKDITPIVKLKGDTPTEILLAQLCDKVFLKLWAYPNPHANHDGKPPKEICDVLAIFENHVFIFSDKESELDPEEINDITWKKWKRAAIDASIRQVRGAERQIKNNPENIFVDKKCTQKLPIPIDKENLKIHRIIVAHGAEEACKKYSPKNIHGSLGVSYSDFVNSKTKTETIGPFTLMLNREEIVHVLDSHNLGIILTELDTVHDLLWYFEAKENAIKKYRHLTCSGEEELLANYFNNFDKKTKKHYIGTKNKKINIFMIADGLWQEFTESEDYQRKKEADKASYLWDALLQKALQNALDGTLKSDGDVFKDETALIDMAKEPRFVRKSISEAMFKAGASFPSDTNKMNRHLGCYPSFYSDIRYVVLIISRLPAMDYIIDHLPVRRELLKIACGMAKNKFPHLKKVIGIAIDPPKTNYPTSESFLLMDVENWTKEQAEYYEKENREIGINFFESDELKESWETAYNFPPAPNYGGEKQTKTKPQRNDPCPCGSGKKYKKCCYFKRL